MPDHLLLRRRGAGPNYKAPELREALFDWFVDIRASLACALTPRYVLYKAKELAERMMASMRQSGVYTPLPKLDPQWLLRWRKSVGISLRRPNSRVKASRQCLEQRLKAMWCNLIRLRRLGQWFLRKDLRDSIYGIDEKPLHFNEAGSKNHPTLDIEGVPVCRLKANHAASRERVSLMTSVTSNRDAASAPMRLPLELLAKAKTSKRTAKLKIPEGLNVSVQWSEKGSYRHANMVSYLKKWLDPWSEVRARRKDYRILMLDVAKSHLSPDLVELAWSRGYCILYHYGCTTAVAQVNDTHCHAEYSSVFCELELASLVEQRLFDANNIGRTLQQVLDDAAATWRALGHDSSVTGHWHNGLSNALDGSEDDWIRGDALLFWRSIGMSEERLRAIAEVDDLVQRRVIHGFDQWQQVVHHPADPGAKCLEGEEFEGELEDQERIWLGAEEEAGIWAEEAEILALEAVQETDGQALAVVAEDETVVLARRLAKLKETLASLRGLGVPAAAQLVNQHIEQMEKQARCGGREDQVESAVKLRAFVKRGLDAERRVVAQRQKEMVKKRRLAAKVNAKKRRAAKKKQFAAKEKAAFKARVEALPKTFTAAMCGEAGGKGFAARVLCLERLKLHSPKLDFEREVGWAALKNEIARERFFFKCEGLSAKASIGHVFVAEIDRVVKELSECYTGPSAAGKKVLKGGDPDAFRRFYDKFQGFMVKSATAVTL